MKISKLPLAVALVALSLSLSAESHAGRPGASQQPAGTRNGRRPTAATPARFVGKRSRAEGARALPARIRNPKPIDLSPASSAGSPAGPTAAPSAGTSARGPLESQVATNVYQVSAHKFDSGSPKFRVQSVHGAKTVTVAGATFQGDDTSKMDFHYKGSPTDMLSLECTLSMAASAAPTFEVKLGGVTGTVPLAAGKSVRTLKFKAPMEGTWGYVSIKSKTPNKAWTWHACTLTVN